jgi:hypothetical protein
MTLKQRKFLFWISVLIFISAVIPLVLYSFGFRFSFEEFKLLRAGGLSVRTAPVTGANILIDGKFEHATSLLSRRLFLQGLTPRPYHIQIEMDGFYAWEKVLRVYPERVTDVVAFLVKELPAEIDLLFEGEYDALQFLDDNESVIVLSSNGEKIFYSIDDSVLLDIGPESIQINIPNDIYSPPVDALGYVYDAQNKRALWWNKNQVWTEWLGSASSLPLYTEEKEALIFSTDSLVKDAQFYPQEEALFVVADGSVSIIELDGRSKRNEYRVFSGSDPSLLISRRDPIIYILDSGELISRRLP